MLDDLARIAFHKRDSSYRLFTTDFTTCCPIRFTLTRCCDKPDCPGLSRVEGPPGVDLAMSEVRQSPSWPVCADLSTM